MPREYFDLTPAPQLLQILGDLKFKGWQCIAELVDNSIDAIINSINLSKDQKKILVTIPTASKIKNNEPLVIEDFADGMDEIKLENAVRAGYSGKNSRDNIGLFGMGFNVATACLANTVEVWSSTKEMDYEIGVVIDLIEMARNKSFSRDKMKRAKNPNKISGTEIKIYDFKKEAESLLKVGDIRDNLNRAYTSRIFDDYGISLKVNQFDIRAFRFCTWSENVSVRLKYDEIPAYVEIDRLLRQENFCENCFTWLGLPVDTTLKIECSNCHSTDQVITKDIQLVGWLGIQRYPDPEHYGIDISRNGRILKKLDKSLFSWQDERAKNDPRFHPEYPRENPIYNGRIVGQLEANFLVPKYTKDDFNSSDKNWGLAVKYLRGEMPLQTDLGESYGYSGLNKSPIGNLFRAYRRIDPPGRKTLMFAKNDGSGKSDPTRQKIWREKFYEGDPKYLDEQTWLVEIDKAELRESISTFNPANPTRPKTYSPGDIKIKSANEERFPGKQIFKRTIRINIENIIGEKPFDLTLIEYYPENDLKTPIIFDPAGAIGKFNVYLNNYHPMFRDFAEGYEDLIFLEVAYKYAMMKTDEQWSVTRIYYELKSKYAPETMLSVPNLVTKASNLMREIQNRLVAADGINLPRKPHLTEGDEKSIKKKHLDLERENISDIHSFIMNTKFLKYLNLNYMFRFIEDFPDVIYDGKILNLPYAELDEDSKLHQLKKYSSYFNDVKWFMNDLAREGDEAVKKLKSQIIRNRYSIEIVHESINK